MILAPDLDVLFIAEDVSKIKIKFHRPLVIVPVDLEQKLVALVAKIGIEILGGEVDVSLEDQEVLVVLVDDHHQVLGASV